MTGTRRARERERVTCDVLPGRGGRHYIICGESGDGTVQTEHGGDSLAPGVRVNGILRADLEPCGCGKWTRARGLEALKGARKVQELGALVQAARALSPGERAGVLRAGRSCRRRRGGVGAQGVVCGGRQVG